MERERRRKRGGRDRERESERKVGGGGVLLAVSVLQIKVRVEVDQDLLARLRGRDDPHAQLGGRVGARVARGGQVVRGVDLNVPPAFICAQTEGRKLLRRADTRVSPADQ